MGNRSNRIVMTGSTGFIGRNLRERLMLDGWEVYSLVRKSAEIETSKDLLCDFNDLSVLQAIFNEIEPRFVLSLAGKAGPGRDLTEFSVHYEDNVLPALNIAKTVPTTVELALFFGSCEEYGNGPTPFREDQTPVAFSPYGWGKISAYYATELTCRERNIPYCWLRPFLTFGPGQETDQLVPAVISACLSSKRVPLTPGEQTRDFIYIQDLIGMIKRILKESVKARNQIFNLGSGIPRRVCDVATKIREFIGKGELEMGALPYRSFEAMSFYASVEKYRKTFGDYSLTDFDQALIRTIEGSSE